MAASTGSSKRICERIHMAGTPETRSNSVSNSSQGMRGRTGLFLGLGIGGLISLIFFAGVLAGITVERGRASSGADISDPNIQNFVSAYRLVTEKSFYRPLDKQRLLYAAINGMLKQTGDPHTLFLSPPQSRQSSQQLNGTNFTGIGALVVSLPRALRVWAPMPGSPAAQAGLRFDDQITAIDGHSVTTMTGDEAIARIHGRAGSIVHLTIARAGSAPFVLSVKRRQIPAITAYGRPLPHNLGYVQIMSFGDTTSGQVDAALRQLAAAHVRGIVLDLRGNPGGYVDAAQRVSSDFLSSGVVAYEQSSNKQLTPLPVIEGRRLTSAPVAVLVDDQTASAAEITAAALQSGDHAVLVGTRTFGKGSMQSVYTLPDGSSVRITDRLWLTPAKHSIAGAGLKPDISIGPSASGSDPDLSAAESYLLRRVSS
jgi:carboxyl-terminal processing protease